jgi:N utilization substance protein B
MKTSPRRRSRELVLQGLYQRQLSGNAAPAVRDDLRASEGFPMADQPYFDEMWMGVDTEYDTLLGALAPHLVREASSLSPVERAIIVMGAWELTHRLDIPYKVVINEAVELAKVFGGTDGHRFVNGVLDKFAATARAAEIAALQRRNAGN